jgi:hypothetical protein
MSTRALLMAAAAAAAAPGQVEFTTAGTYNWNVPEGVTSLCAVLVQGGGAAASTLTYNATVYCRAQNGNRIGDGGGDGGAGGSYDMTYDRYGGGGGAGGYAGNGGHGGIYQYASSITLPAANTGAAAGGMAAYAPGAYGAGGGGVGLKGISATATAAGAAGSGGAAGNSSTGVGGQYGGGGQQSPGGALAYKNDIPVTPGATVTIVVTGNGGARILWGDGRFYPSTNTGDA